MQIYRHFQTIYYKTVGTPLKVQLRTKAILISILVPILSTASVLLTHYVIRTRERQHDRLFLFQVGPYCYLDSLTYMMGAYWYLACEMLSCTARVMADHFQKVVCDTKSFFSVWKVACCELHLKVSLHLFSIMSRCCRRR